MAETNDQDRVFESAAELFSLLSTPVRLKIISAVCNGERNVSELLSEIDTTQPNMSQHLSTLYDATEQHHHALGSMLMLAGSTLAAWSSSTKASSVRPSFCALSARLMRSASFSADN